MSYISDFTCERGTLYSVYEFLERYQGCSLAAYIKDGVSDGEYVSVQEEFNELWTTKKEDDE